MASGEQLNVLVIDDDEDLRQMLVDLLAGEGHQVVPAASAEEGLAQLPFWSFQVAFLDHHLPGIEGLVFGEYLRRNNPEMTIALITGEDDPKLRRRSLDLAIRFIAKPFEPSAIQQVLDETLVRVTERHQRQVNRAGDDYAPRLAPYLEEITAAFSVPTVPARVEDRVVQSIKRALHDISSPARYTERVRVVAFTGLVAAQVLGLELPKARNGHSLYEEYDALMERYGRRREFS